MTRVRTLDSPLLRHPLNLSVERPHFLLLQAGYLHLDLGASALLDFLAVSSLPTKSLRMIRIAFPPTHLISRRRMIQLSEVVVRPDHLAQSLSFTRHRQRSVAIRCRRIRVSSRLH